MKAILTFVVMILLAAPCFADVFPLFPQNRGTCANGQCPNAYPAPVRQTANAVVSGFVQTAQGVKQAWTPQWSQPGMSMIQNPPPQMMASGPVAQPAPQPVKQHRFPRLRKWLGLTDE